MAAEIKYSQTMAFINLAQYNIRSFICISETQVIFETDEYNTIKKNINKITKSWGKVTLKQNYIQTLTLPHYMQTG